MTLTPDRKKQGRRCTGAARDFDAAGDGSSLVGPEEVVGTPRSLREQLEAAGLDLTGHPLGDHFDAMAPVSHDGDDVAAAVAGSPAPADPGALAELSTPEPSLSEPPLSGLPLEDSVEPAGQSARGGVCAARPDGHPVSGESVVSHPLLSDAAWADLGRIAPELTASIEALEGLKQGLRSCDRPLGPDEAVLVIDGVETAARVLEAVSALALSVVDRCGTPTEYGAKSTKALVEHRLQLTGAEAARRAELAKTVGARVSMSGQPVEPLCPIVAEGVHAGVLSAGQAAVIGECVQKLPTWVSAEVRAGVERTLVEHAPRVRVRDLRVIFARLLAEIDPDGQEPADVQDRSRYRVNLRARKNGDWDLSGLLDPVAGGVLHGLLTSRIQAAADSTTGESAGEATGRGSAGEGGGDTAGAEAVPCPDGQGAATGASVVGQETVEAVLSGDRDDAPLSTVTEGGMDAAGRPGDCGSGDCGSSSTSGASSGLGLVVSGVGVREDGTLVDVGGEQGSVRNRLYERFATLISRIDMTRVAAGAPYALVVTAKAEDLAGRTGVGTTGAETPVPIGELAAGGLNGAVFFHLMSEQARTVQVVTEKRFANAKQLMVLAARDQGCTFPGCETPPGWCDAHHIVPWAEQGRTSLNNLTLACGYHHHLIDRSDWHAVMLADGRPAWVPPAVIDPARRPILHARFVAREIIETLFD